MFKMWQDRDSKLRSQIDHTNEVLASLEFCKSIMQRFKGYLPQHKKSNVSSIK